MQHDNRSQIKQNQTADHGSHGARHGCFGILRFARRDRDDLRSDKAEDHECHRHPHAVEAGGEKPSMRGEVRKSDGWRRAESSEQGSAEHDEQNDGDYFDHREPIFKAAEAPDAAGVDVKQSGREHENPQPFRTMRKPPLAVDGDSDRVAADSNALRRPIRVADREAGPRIHVKFGVDSKRTGGGMGDRHLR